MKYICDNDNISMIIIIWEELGIWVAWFILYLRANNSAFKDIMSIMIVYSSDNVLKISLSSFL